MSKDSAIAVTEVEQTCRAENMPPANGQALEDDHDTAPTKPTRKRRRLVISCTECHRRKQKCDRTVPCRNCVSRGKESACHYEAGKPLPKTSELGRHGTVSDWAASRGQRQDRRKSQGSSSGDATPRRDSAPAGDSPAGHKDRGHSAWASQGQQEQGDQGEVNFGYTLNNTGASTLQMIRHIEGGEPLTGLNVNPRMTDDSMGLRERYRALVRQMPSRFYVEKLIAVYFETVNNLYFTIDEQLLRSCLDKWYAMPVSALAQGGPLVLDPMQRSLPALLFQLMASALLHLPDEHVESLNALKYASMTFDDLALDYSESGLSILSLLGKRQMSLNTVLAGWVRSGYLKYSGMVTEAWHQLGTTIRDAQEIGLHKDQNDPQPRPGDSTEDSLDKIWMAQIRRRVWMTLIGWDLHTGAVLGRPTAIDHRHLSRSLPIDAVIPARGATERMPLTPRMEDEPPTPLTRAIWVWNLIQPLREILDLEKFGPFPKDFTRVDQIHKELEEAARNCPATMRLQNPDTRFDALPECSWLPHLRPLVPQLISFNFMALHRPYVFTRAQSRKEGLRASFGMLEAQRSYFSSLPVHHHKTFGLFFGTFDAVVMIASIYILFPNENRGVLSQSVRHIRWAVERFGKMAERNRLAGAALGVINAIYVRLQKAVGLPSLHELADDGRDVPMASEQAAGPPGGGTDTPAGTVSSTATAGQSSSSNGSVAGGPEQTPATTVNASPGEMDIGGGGGANSNSNPFTFGGPQAATPWDAGIDLSTIMPLYPLGDMLFNDVTGGVGFDGTWAAGAAPSQTAGAFGGGVGGDPFSGAGGGMGAVEDGNGGDQLPVGAAGEEATPQFGGDFGIDTIWSVLNQFPSS